jgi:hypothetical protein
MIYRCYAAMLVLKLVLGKGVVQKDGMLAGCAEVPQEWQVGSR